MPQENFHMQLLTLAKTAGLAGSLLLTTSTGAFASDHIQFPMTVSAGAKACLPHAAARVTDVSVGPAEDLRIQVAGLPKNTDFDFFVIQDPVAPFGLAWYQGDIETDSHGNGSGTFVGRFNVETFIVAPGGTQAPVVFNHPPFPDASQNPPTPPVQLYHLGLWFNSPADAAKAGCASTVTPFNGTHNAGIQALNTANFPLLRGPLFYLQ
jgi:hypothetical protein